MSDLPHHAHGLADRPPGRVAGASPRDPADLDAAVRAGRLRGPPDGRPRPGRHRDHRHDRRLRAPRPRRGRLPHRREVARRRRAARAPAVRHRQRLRRGPGRPHGPRRCSPPTRGASSRASRSPPSPSGATEAILAVRGDDPALVTMLEGAVLAAEEAGFLGDDAAGSGHRVTVTVRTGPGRLHAGRGDRPHQGARGQARPAGPAARRTPPRRACSTSPPSSTTSRRWPPSRGSCANGGDAFAAIGATASPGHHPRPAPRPRGRGHRRGPAGHAAPGARARWPAAPAAARSRRCSWAGRPAASCRRTCWTPRTSSTRCARPAPTSAPAPWSSRTTAPASWTSPGS